MTNCRRLFFNALIQIYTVCIIFASIICATCYFFCGFDFCHFCMIYTSGTVLVKPSLCKTLSPVRHAVLYIHYELRHTNGSSTPLLSFILFFIALHLYNNTMNQQLFLQIRVLSDNSFPLNSSPLSALAL